MYRGLVVAIWARNELILKNLYGLINLLQRNDIANVNHQRMGFKELLQKVVDFIDIPEDDLTNYREINATRILNNLFKHSDCIYTENPDPEKSYENLPIEFLSEYGFTESMREYPDGSIKLFYADIKYEKLLPALHVFWKDVMGRTKVKMRQFSF